MTGDLDILRRQARTLLDPSAPRDGMLTYYALHYDPQRTQLFIHQDEEGQAKGMLVVCRTGRDLFRLLALLRADSADTARSLLHNLTPRRPYYLVTTIDLADVAAETLLVERSEVNLIYRLNLTNYAPQINVLVTPLPSATGGDPRFVIRSHGEVIAESGVNWRSPRFAELYVWTAEEARGRGWAKAVVSACASWAIRAGVQPLYIVAAGNEPSISLAKAVGFVDTGGREFAIEGIARLGYG